jgi:uncharacterized protein
MVGTLHLELRFFSPQSLKEKRMILKSLTTRLRKQFNISIAEIDGMDVWQRSILAIAAAGREKSNINRTLDYILDFLADENDVEVTSQQMELI